VRRQIELPNEVAAALTGTNDQVLRALEEHLGCDVFLRGNLITLDGEAEAVQSGATVVRELAELIEQGHEIGPGTISAVTDAHRNIACQYRDASRSRGNRSSR